MHPALIAIGVLDLAPHAMHRNHLHRQVLPLVNPSHRKFGARAGAHPHYSFVERSPVGRLLFGLAKRAAARCNNGHNGQKFAYVYHLFRLYVCPGLMGYNVRYGEASRVLA